MSFSNPRWPTCESSGNNDIDGDVDLDDYLRFADCLNGPSSLPLPPSPSLSQKCLDVFDGDLDNDVDLSDFASFAQSVGGP
ncbi:MAG: hypothetical protein DHS20C16_29040 [Phycisphaerae bacterium]|nr:MAG: hypothetical protein DHS20C16_29040 [Phycisphaerae bacterium]